MSNATAAAAPVRPIPEGYHTLTPSLTVANATAAIEFYKRAFGATEIMRSNLPDGRIMHAEIQVGDSRIMLNDEFPEWGGKPGPLGLGGTAVNLHLFVEDADALYNQAVAAGATVEMELADMFWGDRYGKVLDPYGHSWAIATHQEDVTEEEMMQRMMATMNGTPC